MDESWNLFVNENCNQTLKYIFIWWNTYGISRIDEVWFIIKIQAPGIRITSYNFKEESSGAEISEWRFHIRASLRNVFSDLRWTNGDNTIYHWEREKKRKKCRRRTKGRDKETTAREIKEKLESKISQNIYKGNQN